MSCVGIVSKLIRVFVRREFGQDSDRELVRLHNMSYGWIVCQPVENGESFLRGWHHRMRANRVEFVLIGR